MIIEIGLLKALMNRDNFDKYRTLLNPKILSQQSILLLKDFDCYFSTHKDVNYVDLGEFKTFFFIQQHPNLDVKSNEQYLEIFKHISEYKDDNIVGIIQSFEQQETYLELQRLLEQNVDIETVSNKIEELKERVISLAETEDNKMDIEAALTYVNRENGLYYRTDCLREHLGGVIKGDLTIVAGFTNSGKTTFLADQLSYMATQIEGDDHIVLFNTEGNWKRILPRIYGSAIGCTQKDLTYHTEKAKIKYLDLMKGKEDRIKILDIQGKHIKDIEQILKKDPPRVIVFDLLDHIRGFEKYMSNDGGSFERYSKLYQWALEIANEYAPVFVTSQLNREGFNTMYPDTVNLRGSGVDKQAAATVLLMIGALNGEDRTRYLSTPKCKINGNNSWKAAVQFDPDRGRFI